jgi:hypothetical protein
MHSRETKPSRRPSPEQEPRPLIAPSLSEDRANADSGSGAGLLRALYPRFEDVKRRGNGGRECTRQDARGEVRGDVIGKVTRGDELGFDRVVRRELRDVYSGASASASALVGSLQSKLPLEQYEYEHMSDLQICLRICTRTVF